MPERPKRRKNNKNKRKNKQQSRSEVNRGQNSIDTKKSDESKPVKNDDEPSVSNYVSAKNVTNEQEEIDDSKTESHMNVSQYEINKETDIINTSKQLQVTEIEDAGISSAISDTAELQDYLVESPDQSLKHKVKEKLGNTIKSKSLDNDDEPKIVEIGEYSDPKSNEMSLEILNSSNVTVSDTESDVDWEVVNNLDDAPLPKNNDMAVGTLSIQTIPFTVAKCENNQVLTTEEELSLRKYLQTLDLATHPATLEVQTEIERTVEVKHRLRKKSSPNDFVFTHGPRHLDVIDEEGSGESSLAARRHSALNVAKNDCCSLEDEVFLTKEENEDHQSKINNRKNIKHLTREIPQQCVLVDAKMIAPAISEARGDWSVKTMEKLSGAEVVYLTDSSSSASDIYDLEEEDEIDDGIETDTSVRIITPTIEVTDTDNLLKKQFLAPKENKNDCILIEEETDNTSNKNPHEIIVLSTENINPSLYVINATDEKQESVKMTSTDLKESLNNNISVNNKEISTKDTDENVIGVKSDFGLGDLRIELNDAFSNLVKEVSNSESGNDAKESVSRQDSSSSVCSSQCTAKYNPNYTSLNDITNITHDETPDSNIHTEDTKTMNTSLSSHVKEVFECVTGSTKTNTKYESHHEPAVLKDLCVRRIAQFPYGEKILEELAHVSERLQNISVVRTNAPCININNVKMPYYPLPDVSSIDKVALPIKDYNGKSNDKIAPPPLLPRNSSLKKTLDEPHWTGIPTHKDPVYVCLSPSQKMLMEKTNTIITKEDASQLVDMHKKYVDRRGYDENKNDNYGSPIAIPFKSQTGSRLLALIRDPAVTNNIYSNNTRRHKSVELLHSNTTSHWDKKSFNHNYNNSVKDLNNGGIFRPIPPPRLKKYSSTMYESDESSDFTDNSLRSVKSERKFFHYSTGNLNKQIENDVSSIQSMHRHYVNTRETLDNETKPRRPSLPKDLCEQQMEYIRQKEKEIEAEINRLESKKLNAEKKPRAPLLTDKEIIDEKYFDVNNYHISRKRDIALELPKLNDSKKSLFSSSQEELLRDKMYTEYVTKMAERQERKEKKVIKITNGNKISKSLSSLEVVDPKMNNRIEEEFISKARERWNKLGIRDPETEDEREDCKNMYKEPVVIKHKIKVIEDNEEKEVQQLPNHLQEFVKFTAKKEQSASSPGESINGLPSSHVLMFCVTVIVCAIGRFFLNMLKNK